MSDTADMFKKLAKGRLKPAQAKEETLTQEETQPVPKTKPQKKTKTSVKEISQEPTEKQLEAEIAPEPTKKRGRPATGKRSDRNWIGRTYYIRKETDLDIEEELIKLKRAGIKLDKSSLVDSLLAAWVKWRKGENIDSYLSEISPRQKDELP
ncbi:MAG: hypothetical protein QNJ65_08225 [Xenococcaceae cyanobacterium MO_234.B1]|nr:hypothetical protein [Xenococcaceae cyanobacterium MO_234.B1]